MRKINLPLKSSGSTWVSGRNSSVAEPIRIGSVRSVIGPIAAHVVLPWIHRVFSNLKTWALGVYHGLRRKHLKAYLDEFVFRFNRRHTRHASFASLLGIAMAITPRSYKEIVQLGSTG